MEYIHWGGREKLPLVSRLGFGTTRFLQEDLQTGEGFDRCVDLVHYALNKGINYFDVAPTYSNGLAEKILGAAFQNTKSSAYVAAKTGLMIDKTADDVLHRIDSSLHNLHKDKIDFYHVWSVMDWNQYTEIKKPGGVLDGVIKAKEQGLADHVCISVHSEPETALKIVEEGIFEGITISLNVLNYKKWAKVLEEASRRKIAVVTMNSLGGGIIPRYGKLFENIDDSDDTVPIKALRFALRIPGVNIALSGMPTKEIIDENCEAVKYINSPNINFDFSLSVEESLCSGCNYCAPCTVGIPISACMQAYNHKILVEAAESRREGRQMANDVFIRVRANGAVFPDLRPCIGCHVCEGRCTQKIPISQRMHWLKMESERYGYDNETMRRRLLSVEEKCRESRKIAIWPAADYASRVLDYWGNEAFERRCVFVNSSPAMWGMEFRDARIMSPNSIEAEGIDTIVIMHHRLQDRIYSEISSRYKKIKIVCLHESTDIDWFNRMI